MSKKMEERHVGKLTRNPDFSGGCAARGADCAAGVPPTCDEDDATTVETPAFDPRQWEAEALRRMGVRL